MKPSNMQLGRLVLIIGPSGVGKSVILQELRSKHPDLHVPRSATTRDRREGEGEDLYQFVTDSAFDALLENDEILEWAVVHGGARYGTLKQEIIPPIEQGATVIREVDVQGFSSIWKHPLFREPDAPYSLTSIFILPENKEQLITRITERAPISEEELASRIASMEHELAYADKCTHQIVNKDGGLDDTVSAIEALLFSDGSH